MSDKLGSACRTLGMRGIGWEGAGRGGGRKGKREGEQSQRRREDHYLSGLLR